MKVKQEEALLFAVKQGRVVTCSLPSLRMHTHSLTFPEHRYGQSRGLLYFLETDQGSYFDDPGHALRGNGVLKVYDPASRKVKAQISTCTCNNNKAQLLLRGGTIIDLGKYPRLIATSVRDSSPILQLVNNTEFTDFAVHIHLNKTIYLVTGEYHDRCGKETGPSIMSLGPAGPYEIEDWKYRHLSHSLFFKINAADFSFQLLLPKISPPLNSVSLIPLSKGEFLVLGHRKNESTTLAYRLTESTASLEGSSAQKLGRCSSSALQGNTLYLFFESGVLSRVNLRTGYMTTLNFPKWEESKPCLWVWQRCVFSRLAQAVMRDVLGYLA